jgi:copper homeostasis protein (lipoprotein)
VSPTASAQQVIAGSQSYEQQPEAEPRQDAAGAHGLRLPATFAGDLPCADCEAIRYHLNLWPDQAFALRRIWLGTTESLDTLGRWSVDPERRILELGNVGEGQLQFEILNDRRLRQLDAAGRPIDSELPYELASRDALEPIDPLHVLVSGMFVYMADAARLSECRTGRSYPVATAGDYLRLERAYLEASQTSGHEPGQPLMVTFEASIEERPRLDGGGTEPTAVVERFVNVWPDETCERNRADSSLTNTYWRIVRLGETELGTTEGRREPHLLLGANEPRFSAAVGCNQLAGGYTTAGQSLRFQGTASTMMACPPPLARLQRRLSEALAKTTSWQITGQTLELGDADGQPVALLQAVYLR